MSSARKRVLHLRELVDTIMDLSNRRTLYCAALVCRLWKEAALPRIWRDIQLRDVVSIIYRTRRNHDHRTIFSIPVPPTATIIRRLQHGFERFAPYAALVREVTVHGDEMWEILQQLRTYYPFEGPIFPHLRTLHLDALDIDDFRMYDEATDDAERLILLAIPSVESLTMHGVSPGIMCHLLRLVPEFLPNLQELEISLCHGYDWMKMPVPDLYNYLETRQGTQLKRLSTRNLDFEDFVEPTSLANGGARRAVGSIIFSNVTHLELELSPETLTTIFESGTVALATQVLVFEVLPGSHNPSLFSLRCLCDAIAERCRLLHSLHIRAIDFRYVGLDYDDGLFGDRDRCSIDTIRSLFVLDLRRFELRHAAPGKFSEADKEVIRNNWPELEELVLPL